MNYKLNVQDGKVDYLMMAGKDVVKATTTERMGFEGEELGISSTAVVIIYRQAGEV